MRRSEITPPDKPLVMAEWSGTKIKQVAILPPQHPASMTEDPQEPRVWKYSQLGLSYLDEPGKGHDDRSRTPHRKGKGKGEQREEPKGKGVGKKGKKFGKTIGISEGEELERTGRKFFPGPATLPEPWREKKPDEIVVSGTIDENPGRATMVFKQGSNGIPIFRSWVVTDAPLSTKREILGHGILLMETFGLFVSPLGLKRGMRTVIKS